MLLPLDHLAVARRPKAKFYIAATFGNSGSTPDRGEDDYHNPKEGWQAGEVPPEKTTKF